MKTCKDLTGKMFACYTTLYEQPRKQPFNKRVWRVKCKCSKEYDILQDTLTTSKSKGCPACRTTFTKHGLKGHRLYTTWCSMRNRCNNPNNKDYYLYGGRGISVCKEWDDFLIFLIDMEDGFQEGLTIDRINVNGNYSKSNCRWATPQEQANNKR